MHYVSVTNYTATIDKDKHLSELLQQENQASSPESLHNLLYLLTCNFYLIHNLLRVFPVCCLDRYLMQAVKELNNPFSRTQANKMFLAQLP